MLVVAQELHQQHRPLLPWGRSIIKDGGDVDYVGASAVEFGMIAPIIPKICMYG